MKPAPIALAEKAAKTRDPADVTAAADAAMETLSAAMDAIEILCAATAYPRLETALEMVGDETGPMYSALADVSEFGDIDTLLAETDIDNIVAEMRVKGFHEAAGYLAFINGEKQ